MLINNAHYKEKREMAEFMPHYQKPEGLGSIDDVMKKLSGEK